jgi:hypothetical protein
VQTAFARGVGRLAVVLIAVVMLMVFARQFMARFQGEGQWTTRWLPITFIGVYFARRYCTDMASAAERRFA